jgi:DNA-binding CsgD family transcriptional regulator
LINKDFSAMHHGDSEAVLALVGRIYDAALDAHVWPEVVAKIAGLQGAEKALLFTPVHPPADGGFNFPVGISQAAMQEWADRYVAHDVWTVAVGRNGFDKDGQVFTDEDLVPHDELLQSLWYREFLSRIGIARVCCGMVFGPASGASLMTAFSVYRDVADAVFGERERHLFRILLPHLSRALGIMYRLRDADLKAAASLAALDRLASGVILFGPRRTVLFANRAARQALGGEDGLRLRQTALGQTHLAAGTPVEQQALDTALNLCLGPNTVEVPHFSQVIRIKRASVKAAGPSAWTLNLSALPLANEFGSGDQRPLAIAFLNDPHTPMQIDDALMRRLYGLTSAECRLAQELCLGGSTAALAGRMGLSENTIKTQMKSLFAKMGVNRQTDLVKVLYALHSTA